MKLRQKYEQGMWGYEQVETGKFYPDEKSALRAEEEYRIEEQMEKAAEEKALLDEAYPDKRFFNDEGEAVLESKNGYMLVRSIDEYSSPSESPITYEILDREGKIVWRSGILYNNKDEDVAEQAEINAKEMFEEISRKKKSKEYFYKRAPQADESEGRGFTVMEEGDEVVFTDDGEEYEGILKKIDDDLFVELDDGRFVSIPRKFGNVRVDDGR